jgi:hypothetical protein
MAAIARSKLAALCALLLMAPLLMGAQSPGPDNETNKQPAQVRAVLTAIADDLTGGNADEAMSHFAKDMRDYDTLSRYLNGLLNAFYVSNGIEVTDETDEANRSKLTVRWDLTLTDLQSYYTEDRSEEVSVCFVRKGGKWLISEFSPVSLFDPGRGTHGATRKS